MKWLILSLVVILIWNVSWERRFPMTSKAFKELYLAMKNETFVTWDYVLFQYHHFNEYLENQRVGLVPSFHQTNNHENTRK